MMVEMDIKGWLTLQCLLSRYNVSVMTGCDMNHAHLSLALDA